MLDEMRVDFMFCMPAFSDQLSDAEIVVFLAYIKSNWPARASPTQENRSHMEAASD